jgi:UDP-N-acetylmuramoyl-L-alanyl-D-glutamate--2,6-diaminopimelate ligase
MPAAGVTLADLIQDLPVRVIRGDAAMVVHGLTDDSRRVRSGFLFAARSGSRLEGGAFVSQAIDAGAAAILTSDESVTAEHVCVLHAADSSGVLPQLAARYFGSPSRQLDLVGITGTNGKTTTASLIHQILSHAGRRCGLIGTIEIDDGARRAPAELTTPGCVEFSELLSRMVRHDCKACVTEVSSHALHQNRVAGHRFAVGVFTNLTGDHLDYHGSMDAYAAAKAMLFESLDPDAVAIVNTDDPASDRMVQRCRARILRCSTASGEADCVASIMESTISLTRLDLTGPWGHMRVQLPLVGRHNACNAIEAAATAWSLGIESRVIQGALESCTSPQGRLEPVGPPEAGMTVLVDYAHTDDALDNVLRALRPLVANGRQLRVVFGCGGDRDRTKRPRMARVACRWADDVIITSDNPRTEDPKAIIDEILAGVPHDSLNRAAVEVDRRGAIHLAINRSQAGDVVLIAGKGHETYQILGTVKHSFDDRQVAREALARRCARGMAS